MPFQSCRFVEASTTMIWLGMPVTLNENRFERTPKPESLAMICGGWVRLSVVSTYQLEPLFTPPERKPRARMGVSNGCDNPLICHPPGTGTPSPTLTQSAPLLHTSKVVRQTSGLVPPR